MQFKRFVRISPMEDVRGGEGDSYRTPCITRWASSGCHPSPHGHTIHLYPYTRVAPHYPRRKSIPRHRWTTFS